MNLLSVLVGVFLGLVVVETVMFITLYRFLRSHDVNMFSDDWYPVRIKRFPFTTR
jgi:hypothetical protein